MFFNLPENEARKFKCGICEKAVRRAVTCDRSGHLFCQECLDDYLDSKNIAPRGALTHRPASSHSRITMSTVSSDQPSSANTTPRRSRVALAFRKLSNAASAVATAVVDVFDGMTSRPSHCPLCNDRHEYHVAPDVDAELAVEQVACPFFGLRGPCRWEGAYEDYRQHGHVFRHAKSKSARKRSVSRSSSGRSVRAATCGAKRRRGGEDGGKKLKRTK